MDPFNRDIRVWDWPLRLFHWLLVISVALAFLSSEEDSALHEWHVLSGWVAALLIGFRVAWGFIGGEHSRFSDFIRPSHLFEHMRELRRGRIEPSLGHNSLGGIAVLFLLGLTAVTVWTGAFGGAPAEELHEIIAWTLLAMIALHVTAVAAMSFLQRENLLRAMITGDKPAVRHPGAADARPPAALGYFIAAISIAGLAYGILQYDPQAFTLRTAESFEHRADLGLDDSHSQKDEEKDD